MSTNVIIMMRGIKEQPVLLTFLLVAALIGSLCIAFVPCWERNDDVAMSMIAHGYGLAAHGSPLIVDSNVLWGYLVRAIPSIDGVLGYSIATITVLFVFGWATLYFLIQLGAGYLLGFPAIALLIALPTLVPQFTVNAGLLTVAAVIGWRVYARHGSAGSLVAACLLAFFGYLIRDKEFLLVLGVALPLFPWRALRERRQMQIALLLLGLAIVSAAAFDRWSYSGPEWRNYRGMDASLTSIIDFHAGEYLKQHPEILARHGYSQNDIDLVSDWFFVDSQIVDPKSLNAMLDELGPIPMQEGSAQSGISAIKALLIPVLLPLLLPALLLLVLSPRWSVALAWILFLAALFAMGVMGRPGALRVYIPVASLLLIAPLVLGKLKEGNRQKIIALFILAACIGNAYLLIPVALSSKQWAQQVRHDIHSLPDGPIVSWGEDFPYELAFPVLSNDINSHNIKLYGLNAFTHAPYSVANTEQMAGRGMLDRLRTATGIPIIASPKRLKMLGIYCSERLNGQLRVIKIYQTRSLTVQQVQCEAGK